MASLQSLAKDTAIYGLSSIIGRFLNYLLVPIYTLKLAAANGGYGVITNVYAYTALLMVILTYGMETTFFRFANKDGEDSQKVYSTTLVSIGTTSAIFFALVMVFIGPVSSFLGYAAHPSWVWVMALTVAIDAFKCIPFDYLRYKNKPLKFASLQLLNIGLTILLNIIYFVFLNGKDVGFAFYINLACTVIVTLCLYKELTGFKYVFDKALLKRMLGYSWPVLVLGIAGILNQTADKILFPYVYEGADAHAQLGIYGAASKIAMIMAMITQAFRFAYEPFVFGNSKEKDSKRMYAEAMKYFIIFTLLAFLAVISYLDLLKYLIGRDYWEGLKVVPIVMAAEIMMGIYFNLSFWYKLIDKTIWGAWFSGIGCIVLIAINVLLVPRYGYMACAWAGFAGYGTAMLLSYFVGQKKYPINYPLKSIAVYVLLTMILYAAAVLVPIENVVLRLIYRTLLLCIFVAYILKKDLPLSSIPYINRFFKKH